MLGVMTRVNKLLIIFLGFAYSVAVASSGHHVLKQLSHSKPPHVANAHGLSVAVVFPTEGIAQLIVLRSDSVEARSAAFEFTQTANYGAASVEQIKISSSSTFALSIRTRLVCGPGVYDYYFAQHRGRWVVSGLEREEGECSGDSVVPAWSKSYNYLTGKTESVAFQNGRRNKVTKQSQFPVFELRKFEAFGAAYER